MIALTVRFVGTGEHEQFQHDVYFTVSICGKNTNRLYLNWTTPIDYVRVGSFLSY